MSKMLFFLKDDVINQIIELFEERNLLLQEAYKKKRMEIT